MFFCNSVLDSEYSVRTSESSSSRLLHAFLVRSRSPASSAASFLVSSNVFCTV
ncbi:hypothetical protein Hanom_Chr09g00866351 [Helianthus anomalus]